MTNTRPSEAGPAWLAWTVLSVATLLLVGSVAFTARAFGMPYAAPGAVAPRGSGQAGPMMGTNGSAQGGGTPGGMMGGGMMTGRVWLAGDGVRVQTIAQARARATQAASAGGLRPGEVMQFSDNFYVELKDTSGTPTTEVLVNPVTGAVSTEYGPAMMWNTGSRSVAISEDRAVAIADRWLQTNAAGQAAGSAEAYPGYYTIDTTSGGTTVGMLSVNATTGAVWPHTWHGRFIAEEDA